MNCKILIAATVLFIAGLVFLNWNAISGLALAEENELYPMGNIFPLGVYDAHEDEAFSDLSNSHFKMVHVYSSTMSVEGKEYITACAKYDNLAWWYIPEEPKKDQYEHVENLYNWIKRYDPKKRPAGTYHAGGRTAESLNFWQEVNDFVLSGSYPNYYEKPRIWVKWKMKQEIKGMPKAAPVFCGQFFALDKPPIQPREAYHDSYLGIVSGAKAIVLYSYSRGISECPKETWGAYKKVADEIGGKGNLGPVILSPDVPQKIKVEVIDGPKMAPEVKNQMYPSVNWLEKHYERHVYLFVVNSAVEEVTVKISDLPANASKAEVLFQNRSVDITDGSFTEKFEQYDVNIYKMPN